MQNFYWNFIWNVFHLAYINMNIKHFKFSNSPAHKVGFYIFTTSKKIKKHYFNYYTAI